jgi:acyl-CoA dehydrogenase
MSTNDWVALMGRLGTDFAKRCEEHDEHDSFVAENYAKLKEAGAFAAGVPIELGGGGASHAELCAMIRELAHHCSSTALAFSMHTHLIATLSWIWRSGNKGPEPMLRRVAAEKLVLVSTGGSDWLSGSGKLEKVEGGYRMTGRKIFGSGVPAGDLLMTTGVYDDPKDGPTVIHFPLSLKAEGVKVLDTWKVLGMRGTGSHDVLLENVFVPDAAMGGVHRPVGKWHPFMHTVALVALPVIYAAYLGVAESARELALKLAAPKKQDALVPVLVGEMENQIVTAQLAHASMVQMATTEKPGPATTSATMSRRTIVAAAAIRAVEKALEVAGGAGFYRSAGLERAMRDIQASRYHPLPEKQQMRLTGRQLLGLEIDL